MHDATFKVDMLHMPQHLPIQNTRGTTALLSPACTQGCRNLAFDRGNVFAAEIVDVDRLPFKSLSLERPRTALQAHLVKLSVYQ